jgi:hypothetical protein
MAPNRGRDVGGRRALYARACVCVRAYLRSYSSLPPYRFFDLRLADEDRARVNAFLAASGFRR